MNCHLHYFGLGSMYPNVCGFIFENHFSYFHLLFSLSKGHHKSARGSPPRTRALKLWEKKNNFTSLSLTILFFSNPNGCHCKQQFSKQKTYSFTVNSCLDAKKLQPVPKYKMELTSRFPFLPQVRSFTQLCPGAQAFQTYGAHQRGWLCFSG